MRGACSSPERRLSLVLSKRAFTLEHVKEGRIYQFVALLENRPSALSSAASVLARNNLAALSGFHYIDSKNNWEEWSFFVDFSKAKVTPEQVSDELSKEGFAKRVEFMQGEFPDLAIDEAHFPIVTGEGDRAVFLRETTIRIAIEKLWSVFGPGAATILWEMGRAAGEYEAKMVKERLKLSQLDVVKFLLADKRASGWYVGEMADATTAPVKLTIRAVHSPECEHRSSKQKESRSFFLKGYLEGYVSLTFEKPLKIKETRCRAKGDDFCEFQLQESEK